MDYLGYLKSCSFDKRLYIKKACFLIGSTLIFILDNSRTIEVNSNSWRLQLTSLLLSLDPGFMNEDDLYKSDDEVFNFLTEIIDYLSYEHTNSFDIRFKISSMLNELLKECTLDRILDIVHEEHEIKNASE